MDIGLVETVLRDVGYPLVRRAVPVTPGSSRFRLDVVAWGPDPSGELVPQVAVEMKRHSGPKALPDALRQLAIARDVLGTNRHYVVLADRWYVADAGLINAAQVDGPEPPANSGPARLTDARLVADLLSRRLLVLTDRHGRHEDTLLASRRLIDESLMVGGVAVDGQAVQVPSPVLAEALFDGLLGQLSRSSRHKGENLTLPSVGRALAQLLHPDRSGVLFDPFCGSGSLLWHAVQVAEDTVDLRLIGQDINPDIIALARLLCRLLPRQTDLRIGDSLEDELPDADFVITQPPLRLSPPGPYRLSDGSNTRDGDLVVLDRCLRVLRPGGRAVVHTLRGWTWREDVAARYRSWLADHVHVMALIALPTGLLPASAADSLIVVLQRTAPGETFVAQLNTDWSTQLGEDGPALAAYYEHLARLR